MPLLGLREPESAISSAMHDFVGCNQQARVAELADALDSGLCFSRFHSVSFSCKEVHRRLYFIGLNSLLVGIHDRSERNAKLAQTLAQKEKVALSESRAR